jgi:DNA-binding NarL/FixJ family response regulator
LTTRILIVDDFQPFRNTLRSILERDSSLRVIGEACDGIEGIEKAAILRPDVVLLDIGMPRLNGIEAAKAIRQKVCPESTIIFVTQEDDCDIRSSALGVQQLTS